MKDFSQQYLPSRMFPDLLYEDSYKLLKILVQNRCINPPGNEMRSIITIHDHLQQNGIKSEIIETDSDRGCLLATLKSDQPGSCLMFGPSHVDVVPVQAQSEWNYDPFEGVITEGKMFGRGTFDMLFYVVSQVQAFIQLQKAGYPHKGSLKLLIVCDEERGGQLGAHWLEVNRSDVLEADYSIGEIGGGFMSKNRVFITLGEKGAYWKKLILKGKPGHGSTPFGPHTAPEKAAIAVLRLIKYSNEKMPLDMSYLSKLVNGLGYSKMKRFFLTKKWSFPLILKMLKKSDPGNVRVLHSLTRMTMSPNIIKTGIKSNVIPEIAEIIVDLRALPGQDDAYVEKHIRKALGKLAKEVIIEDVPEMQGTKTRGTASDFPSPFSDLIQKTAEKMIPNLELVPLLMPGATDLRYLRKKGAIGYGFSLMDPIMPISEFATLAHGIDEYITLKSVDLSLDFYYNLGKEISE